MAERAEKYAAIYQILCGEQGDDLTQTQRSALNLIALSLKMTSNEAFVVEELVKRKTEEKDSFQ